MKKNQLILIIGAVLAAIFLAAPLFAADFEITKVIEIGPADMVPFLGPLKWSPDGTMISYFNDGYLLIADTSGYSWQVKKVEAMPRIYEWVGDSLIFIEFVRDNRVQTGALKRVFMNVYSGMELTPQDFFRRYFTDDSIYITDFEGPKRTVEGNLFYKVSTGARGAEMITAVRNATHELLRADPDNHFVRWGEDGAYVISCKRGDSIKVIDKPVTYVPIQPVMSPNMEYLITRGMITRLKDKTIILLDTLIDELPPRTVGCSFIYQTFDPSGNEILLQLSCDDGHMYVVNSIGVFNLLSNKLTIIDPIISKSNCTSPRYSPDGKRIAFLSEGRLFVIERTGK